MGSDEALGGEDARDACEVVGDAEVGPLARFEKWLHGGQAVVAKFEDKQAIWL